MTSGMIVKNYCVRSLLRWSCRNLAKMPGRMRAQMKRVISIWQHVINMYQTMQQWSSDNALHMHMHLVRPPDLPARALELTARHSIHPWAVGRSYHDRIPKPELLESRTLPLGISDRVSTRICWNVWEALVKELQRDIFITARLHLSANLAHRCHLSSANDKIHHWRTLAPWEIICKQECTEFTRFPPLSWSPPKYSPCSSYP